MATGQRHEANPVRAGKKCSRRKMYSGLHAITRGRRLEGDQWCGKESGDEEWQRRMRGRLQ